MKCKNKTRSDTHEHELGRGVIQDNALKAMVTSQLFKTRVVKAKKGKGSFSRKMKHRGKEPGAKGMKKIHFAPGSFVIDGLIPVLG
ncbi:alternative ribosome-rescue factor A [Vibrio navarrensis]|uniref:alternative ribosome-rescue factor A n=1 Tax=Vibrio navarrensis TaxID=29495 RepID=UPI00186AB233|nr:ribosome alternative rescue factor ArfA [Vibrio navarrensis]EHA1124810.1 alternative ribosome-rescue factor A [Vibrio navarrensis]